MFYRSTELYSPGEIVHKGHFGRLILGRGTQQWNYLFYREYLFEKIREKEFPNLPSRMNSTFVFQSEIDARRYENRGHYREHIYRVIEGGNPCQTFKADMAWVDYMDDELHSFEKAEEAARAYWGGIKYHERKKSIIELLLNCDVTICEELPNGTQACPTGTPKLLP